MNWLTKYWHKLSGIGTSENQSFAQQSRICLANRLGFLNIFMGFFLIVTLSSSETFNPLPIVIFILINITLPLVNYIGLNQLSRFIIAISPAIVVLGYDINAKIIAKQPLEALTYVSPHFVITASIALPLTLFTIREKLPLFLSTLIVLIGIFGFDEIYKIFDAHFTQAGLESSRYGFVIINVFIVVVILLSTFSFLIGNNQLGQKKLEEVLKVSKETNARLKMRETELQETFKQIEENRHNSQLQSWISGGLAEFARLMRDNQNEDKLYPLLINRTIKYLNASQGALFVINDKNSREETLKMAACYAYNRQQYERKEILIGEGLIGQAFKVQQIVNLKEVPEGYAKIGSVLGDANPKALLIIPLVYNGESLGVIELASFEVFEEHQITFMKQLGEGIASTLKTINTNKKTEQLLLETQKQYQIIQAQEKNYLAKEQDYLVKISTLQQELEQLKSNLV